jgi:membrane protease YdiL (CAAX protease family)
VFRGWLQPVLGRRLRRFGPLFGLTAGNLAASAAFAGLHLIAHPPELAPAYLALSLLLGIARERSGGVALPIALHAGFNIAWWRFAS